MRILMLKPDGASLTHFGQAVYDFQLPNEGPRRALLVYAFGLAVFLSWRVA